MGGLVGAASVSATGTAGYEIPLRVVPGRGGLQPNLSLSYSSQAGNGQLGMGFTLTGLSQISRCPKTLATEPMTQGVQLGDSDLFCLNGQRLIGIGAGAYGADGKEYRTLPDTHMRVKSFRAAGTPASVKGPTTFQVWGPDGRVETYAANGDAAQVQTSTGSANTAWPISQVKDRSGNTIQFEYGKRTVSASNASEVERWIDKISYGRVGKMDRQVRFQYGDTRPDKRFGYALGQPRESTKRLETVTMSLLSGPEWKQARQYTLSYENSGPASASKLAKVRECGANDSECRRDTILSWTLGSDGFLPGKEQTTTSGAALVPSSVNSQVVAADFTGDGRTDVAWPEASGWKYLKAQATSGQQVYTQVTDGPSNSAGTGVKAWPLDYDKDGRMDLLPRDAVNAASTWKPLVTRPSGNVLRATTPFTGGFNQGGGAEGAIPGDFDGDGYQDVLQFQQLSSTSWKWTWRKNTGTVSSSIDDTTAPIDDKAFSDTLPVAGLGSEHPAGLTVADVFGDGRDQVLFNDDGQMYARDVAKGTTAQISLPAKVLQLDKQWLDLNGDGLVDLLTNGSSDGVKKAELFYWLNTGRGFTGAKASGVTAGEHAFANALVVDDNGDGRGELLVPRLAGGAQFEPLYAGLDAIRSASSAPGALSFTRTATTINFNAMSKSVYERQGPRLVDADGDGLSDVLLVERPPAGTTGSPALKLFLHKTDGGAAGDQQDLLWRVYEGNHFPKGALDELPATLEFRYAPLTDAAVYSRGNCPRATGLACMSGGSYVVKQMRRDSGIDDDTVMMSDYFYREGRTDKFGRGTLGFTERKVTTYPSSDSSRSVVERSFYTNTKRHKDPALEQRWMIHKLSGNRQRLEHTESDWDIKGSNLVFFNYVSKTRQRSYEFPAITNLTSMTPGAFEALGKEPFRSVTTSVKDMDEYGNAHRTYTHAVSAPKVRENSRTVLFTPDVDAANWLVRRPQKVVTMDQAIDPATGTLGKQQIRTRAYTYEGSTDRIDTVKSYASDAAPGRQLKTAFDYEDGNVIRRTSTDLADGTVRETTYAYDDLGYPHAVQNGRQHTSYTGYDPVLGVLKVAVDANGLRTDHTYDTLGRLVKTRLPSGAERTVGYSLVEAGEENLVQAEVKDGTGAVTQTVVDRLGRPVTERFKGFDNTMRQQTLSYTPQGMRASMSTVHPVGTPPAQVDKTTYSYDDAGRLVKQRDPDSAAPRTWEYSELTTTYTDARGNIKTTTVDHNDMVVGQVDDDNTSGPPTRVYRYGPFGTLLSTRSTSSDKTETTYTYDDQGALLSSTDGDRGAMTYGYNAFGEVTSTTDAKGRHTAFTYDVLGRETLRATTDKNGVSTSTATRTWDTVSGRTWRGALMQVTSDDRVTPAARGVVTTDYAYDSLGRPDYVSQTQPANASPNAPKETLTTNFDHDSYDRLTSVGYPKMKGQSQHTQVTYNYGPAATTNGRLSSVQSGTETLWTAKDFDSQDRLVKEQAGDGTVTSQTLDWSGQVLNRSVVTHSTDINPNTSLFAETYTYDDENNLKTRTQGPVTEEFTYDPLNRLATAKTRNPSTGQVFQTDDWHYDKLGNIISSELRGTYAYGNPARPHLVTQVSGGLFGTRTYGYDEVGNQTSRPGATVTYNDLNLPATHTPTSGTTTAFLYDGNGERIRKTGSQSTITYLPGLYERHQSGTNTDHRLLVKAEGRTVATLAYRETADAATVTKQPTLYTHTDHLGSPRLITKHTGPTSSFAAAVVEKRSYDALGKLRNPDLTRGDDQYTTGIQPRTLHQGYTGHDEDDELNLVNMRARLYDPTLGRFTTPDTIATGANPTQAYNRYAYVSNNPLKYTDPTGHQECSGSNCNIPECPVDVSGCGGNTGQGGTTDSDPCAQPGAPCADNVTIYGNPHDAQDDVTAPGAGDPNGADGGAGEGCSGPGCNAPDDDNDPNQDRSDCEPLCRDNFGYKEPASSPTQTNNVTPADTNGNQAPTDIGGNAERSLWGEVNDYLEYLAFFGNPPQRSAEDDTLFLEIGGGVGMAMAGTFGKSNAAIFRGSRGGAAPSFAARPGEFRVDPKTGFVRETHGVSVFNNAGSVASKGFTPHRIDPSSFPSTLRVIQRGSNSAHYEIVPAPGANLTPEQFAAELAKIKTLP
ncbi:RHS repeat-associated core domain-containing protein [Streptomyces sp. R11]|uniref:RHS repeat-associated core domain-containing protein n=1 Tax=Streptomyces sp. R11 TaxID=3238625 RepID=A0AB39NF82_9ACTN